MPERMEIHEWELNNERAKREKMTEEKSREFVNQNKREKIKTKKSININSLGQIKKFSLPIGVPKKRLILNLRGGDRDE